MPHTITRKGQVTIPKKVRDFLGLQPGMQVRFDLRPDGAVVLEKATGDPVPASRFAKLRGTAKSGLSTDEIMALTRQECL